MRQIKRIVKKIPLFGYLLKLMYERFFIVDSFQGSSDYWKKRYSSGGNSGCGSYGGLAKFKAEIINKFVLENHIDSVIEFGCGDGNQLSYAIYPKYIGFDVSEVALSLCSRKFDGDESKKFLLDGEYSGQTSDLTLSLDVIYHLVEDEVFDSYMARLFDSSKKFVIIYSSNNDNVVDARHVRHRIFTSWVNQNRSNWKLILRIGNKFPYCEDDESGSFADFYIYEMYAAGAQG
ncbi:hypothetical protein [Castellaniella sp.]|uniref:hypothetical protein n=1 Tax=Castellaniella sp. TaxID=1955812 RepID=UPI002AFDF6D3|nr:hypothetical protein [Castellaniella sp.]